MQLDVIAFQKNKTSFIKKKLGDSKIEREN
jgi:hypothetical protein